MMKQIAITKTTPACGTYCLRLKTAGGSTLEYLSTRSLPYDELIEALKEHITTVEHLRDSEAKA